MLRWRRGDGATLGIATNLGRAAVAFVPPSGVPVLETREKAVAGGQLSARATAVFIESPA